MYQIINEIVIFLQFRYLRLSALFINFFKIPIDMYISDIFMYNL